MPHQRMKNWSIMIMNNGEYTDYKVVKEYVTSRFEVILVELSNGAYRIISAPNSNGETDQSEAVKDYLTASYLFDMKIQEFEGN